MHTPIIESKLRLNTRHDSFEWVSKFMIIFQSERIGLKSKCGSHRAGAEKSGSYCHKRSLEKNKQL